jgi:hypothetical protein
VTEADLAFAARVLECPLGSGGGCYYLDAVALAGAEIALRYHGLTRDTGRENAARLARAWWLGKFLAERGAGGG